MKKILALLLCLHTVLFAYSYNELLLKAQTSLFPKILLLDEHLQNKLVDGKIVYLVVYEENDVFSAVKVTELLEESFKARLDEYDFEVRMLRFEEIDANVEATAIYALNSELHIGRLAEIAQEKGIVTFAYDIAYLKKGLLLSLMVEKSTVLYLARPYLAKYRIEFVDVLYQIVRFIDE